MRKEASAPELGGKVVVYESPGGGAQVEVLVGDDTVWLTQRHMAYLFNTTFRNIGMHIENAYDEGAIAKD